MVFSSIPLYLDPHNWHQQQNQHQQHQGIGSSGNTQAQILQSPPPQPSQLNGGGAGGMGSIRPGSMVDRARLAKLPQPEPGLNCPRCDSTNTKFCYFNNYNLTQPRHFCKTCRRYWTRGGALRNVPVGGGCRKNKRSTKTNRATNSGNPVGKSSSSITSATPSNYSTEVNATNCSQLPILPSLDNLGNSSSGTAQFGTSNLGLNFGATQRESDLVFIQLGSSSNNNNNSREGTNTIMPDQWRNSQHFPFTTNFEPNTNSSSMYQLFQNDHQNVVEAPSLMKIEDQNQLGRNLRKPLFLGDSQNSNHYNNWGISGGNSTWNDFSSAGGNPNSSSPSHHLL